MLSAEGLYGRLLAAYGRPPWWSEDAYTVMFQAVLVQNTAWTNVQRTCAAMGGALSPANIAAMGQEELEGHIRPCGFCKGKARTVSGTRVMATAERRSPARPRAPCARSCWASAAWGRRRRT